MVVPLEDAPVPSAVEWDAEVSDPTPVPTAGGCGVIIACEDTPESLSLA